MYVIRGDVYPIGAVRNSLTAEQKTQAIDSRQLTQDEMDFALKLGQQAPNLDIIGLDLARSSDDTLSLMEVNRSPGFGAFAKLTGINLADILYEEGV